MISIIVLLSSCRNRNNDPGPGKPVDYRESLLKANKEVVITENDQINDYVARHGWDMNTTQTGLRLFVYKKGGGPKPSPGDLVRLNYTLTLLTGDTVYSSKEDGPLLFEVGKGQVVTGMEEAILLLEVGDRAKIIIPSHLAFGLIGDQDRINHKATLVYDIEFVSTNNP